jgi:hypothetical protein
MAKAFGTNTALTVTNLHSLGDGSWWQSASIDNSSSLAEEAHLFITILTTTTAGSDGFVDVYLAASQDGGTDFAGGASGSEGSYTVTGNSDEQLRFVASIPVDASETTARTYEFHTVVHDLPERFSILMENNTGAAIGSSTNAVEYQLVTY